MALIVVSNLVTQVFGIYWFKMNESQFEGKNKEKEVAAGVKATNLTGAILEPRCNLESNLYIMSLIT